MLPLSASGDESVVYLSKADPRELAGGGIPDLPRFAFAATRVGDLQDAAVALREFRPPEDGSAPELQRAVPAGGVPLRVTAVPAEPRLDVEGTFDLQGVASGRYAVRFEVRPSGDWEAGQVRIVAIGRRVSGDGAGRADFRREFGDWWLVSSE